MSPFPVRLAASFLLAYVVLLPVAAQQKPVPPVKPGLWESRTSALDADGHEVAPPEQAALSNMPPEARAKMAEAMKARGVSMPDANGATKVCLTKEMFESGMWQQMASQAGCTVNYSTLSAKTWKWHSSCTAFKSESDGEAVFSSPESYRIKLTTAMTVMGKPTTSTRIVESKWLGADCGEVKPFAPFAGRK